MIKILEKTRPYPGYNKNFRILENAPDLWSASAFYVDNRIHLPQGEILEYCV